MFADLPIESGCLGVEEVWGFRTSGIRDFGANWLGPFGGVGLRLRGVRVWGVMR